MPFWGGISIQVGRGVLRRADRARHAFYRRVSNGETPGYPRYKSSRRWHTIELANVDSGMIRSRDNYCAVRVKGLPEIRLRKGFALPEGASEGVVHNAARTQAFCQPDMRGRTGGIARKRCRCRHRHGRVRTGSRCPTESVWGDGARQVSILPACSAGCRNAERAAIAGASAGLFSPITSTESASAIATSVTG